MRKLKLTYESIGRGIKVIQSNKGDVDNPFGLKGEHDPNYMDKIDHVTSILQSRLDYLINSVIKLTGMFDNADEIRSNINFVEIFVNKYFIEEMLFLNKLLYLFNKNRFEVE